MANQYYSDQDILSVLRKIILVLEEKAGISHLDESVPFSYNNFKKIMMTYNHIKPVISFERTLRRKYDDLIVCGFADGGRELSHLHVREIYDYLDRYEALA